MLQSDWFRVRAEFWPILRTVNGMWIHWDTQLLKYEKQKYGIYRPWSACLEYGSITVTNTNTVTITITAYSSSSLFIQLRPSYNRNYLVIWWEVKWKQKGTFRFLRACVRVCTMHTLILQCAPNRNDCTPSLPTISCDYITSYINNQFTYFKYSIPDDVTVSILHTK